MRCSVRMVFCGGVIRQQSLPLTQVGIPLWTEAVWHLKSADEIVLFIAHSLRWADQIVVLSPTGHIEQIGTLNQLLASNDFIRTAYQNRNRRAKGKAREDGTAVSPPEYDKVASTPTPGLPRLRDTSSRRVYWHYFRAFGTTNFVLFLVLGLAFTFTLRFPDVWLSWWASDSASANPQRRSAVYLSVYVGLQIAALVLIAIWAW